MLFNSVQFLVFFPIVVSIYFILPHKFRWLHLLIASCIFYMYFVPVYILLLFANIIVNYFAGILIEDADEKHKKTWQVLSLVFNIGLLAFFKYYNFFIENINELLHISNSRVSLPFLHILLPLGLSFHTFQAIAYTTEIYREEQKAERNFGLYSLYIMFFPQLVAGPIERPQAMLPQLHKRHELDYDNVAGGIRQMLWGMIKKVVIADRLSLLTTPMFHDIDKQSGIGLAIGAVFFLFQVFCDFSGYSDIAIGAARVLGFKLMTNFNFPYRSRSVSEFWKRWHISLSTWFNDYLYTPIVYSLRKYRYLSVIMGVCATFLISGFWHGAAWKYIVWGGLLGLAVIYEILTKKTRARFFDNLPRRLSDKIAVACTFVYLCMVDVFFVANDSRDGFHVLKMFTHIPSEIMTFLRTHKAGQLNLPNLYTYVYPGLAAILLLETVHWFMTRYDLKNTFKEKPALLRWTIYYSGLFLLLFCGVYEKTQFIYFQF